MQPQSREHYIDADSPGKRRVFKLVFQIKRIACNSIEKITRPARERDEEQRAQFQADIGENYPPETLVFLDESACNRMTGRRSMGWAPIGKRARRHDYFVRGQR